MIVKDLELRSKHIIWGILPLSYIPCLHREIELTNPKAKGQETQRHYS